MFLQFLQEKLNITPTASQLDSLEKYCQYLIETNEKFNLTAIVEREQIYIKHFADSLIGNFAFSKVNRICDVGAGAGFPSLPLAIFNSDKQFTLVDSLNKRVNFCREVAEMCNLSNVKCVHDRAEDFAKNNRESFDCVTARAVAPMAVLLEYLAPLVKLNGIVVTYKTDRKEADETLSVAKLLGLKLQTANQFQLPDGEQRCIIIYKKIALTPKKFPRQGNQPRKNPLK